MASLSHEQIGRALAISKGFAAKYLSRVEHTGGSGVVEGDGGAGSGYDAVASRYPSHDDRVLPDFTQLHTELNRPGVMLALLWEKHAVANARQLTHLLRAGIV